MSMTKCRHCNDEHVCHIDQDNMFISELLEMEKAALQTRASVTDDAVKLYLGGRAETLEEIRRMFSEAHPGAAERTWPA